MRPTRFSLATELQHPLGAGFAGAQDLLPHGMDEQTALSHAARHPARRCCGKLPLCGTPDEVIDQAAEWRDCGVRYLVLTNLSFLQRSLRKGLASALSVQTRSSGDSKSSSQFAAAAAEIDWLTV